MKKTENHDPYDTKVITPTTPRCVVKGDPMKDWIRVKREKEEKERGEKKDGIS